MDFIFFTSTVPIMCLPFRLGNQSCPLQLNSTSPKGNSMTIDPQGDAGAGKRTATLYKHLHPLSARHQATSSKRLLVSPSPCFHPPGDLLLRGAQRPFEVICFFVFKTPSKTERRWFACWCPFKPTQTRVPSKSQRMTSPSSKLTYGEVPWKFSARSYPRVRLVGPLKMSTSDRTVVIRGCCCFLCRIHFMGDLHGLARPEGGLGNHPCYFDSSKGGCLAYLLCWVTLPYNL